MRQFTDLDILIEGADFQAASQLLISMGYRVGYDLSAEEQGYHVARHGEMLYLGEEIDVDLHVRLLGERFRFSLAFDEFWDRRQLVTVAGGTDIPTISDEDLVYLAVHRRQTLLAAIELDPRLDIPPATDSRDRLAACPDA